MNTAVNKIDKLSTLADVIVYQGNGWIEQIKILPTQSVQKENLYIRIQDMKKVAFHINEERMNDSVTWNKDLPFGKE